MLLHNGARQELSGGFRLTTNNRMEILAAIEGLAALKDPAKVTVYSDSQYVVNTIQKGWARKWRANNWMHNKEERAVNPDLCAHHDVTFQWVRGHNGIPENERCDCLAVQAATANPQRPDPGYKS